MYVRNCWYVAAWDYELKAGAIIARTIINEPVALFRKTDGSIVGLYDRCPHRFAPLSLGRIEENDQLRCMYHGLKFDSAGKCVEIPGQDSIPARACVKTYPVVEKHSWIWVWMGDPAQADENLIPGAVGLEDPRYTLRSGYLDYQANYGLINDNLTDFSHLSYVHANSFGTNEDWARTRPAITQLPRGIRVQRWMPAGMGGMRKEDSPLAQANARTNLPPTDHWQSYDFLAPGILLMRSRMFEAGAMEKLNGAEPDEDFGPVFSDTFTSQAVTPMTDSTSRYFFSWGPKAGPGSDELAEAMLKVAHMAFGEDKIIIEAQQRVMDSTPEAKEVLTSADVGPTQMRAVINRLIAAESAGPEKAAAKRTRVPA